MGAASSGGGGGSLSLAERGPGWRSRGHKPGEVAEPRSPRREAGPLLFWVRLPLGGGVPGEIGA